MIVIIHPQVDLDPVDCAVELVAAWAVIRRDRRAFVFADVAGLIAGVRSSVSSCRGGLRRPSCRPQTARRCPLGQAASVILELHAYLVFAGGDRLGTFDEG